MLDERGENHGRPLYRVGGHRCWCGLGLFRNLINRHATHSQKECVNHPQGCENPTKYNASDPAHDIYYALAKERAQQSKWLADANYVDVLREAGCFDPRTAPQPEQFAELMASVEEKIHLQSVVG